MIMPSLLYVIAYPFGKEALKTLTSVYSVNRGRSYATLYFGIKTITEFLTFFN
jgi:hypothetical protein